MADGEGEAVTKGLFLVFEGIEGSGKTTQAGLLGEWLAARRIAHVSTREPGGTAVGEGVRALLLHGDEMDPRSELLLYLSARAALVAERVMPALERGLVVVADRYELSTLAYQGYGRELPLEAVRRANAFATRGLRPDLTILLQLPGRTGAARQASRGEADRIERAGTEFHDRVARGYGELIRTEAGVEAIDGTLPPDRIHRMVVDLLERQFPETFAARPG